MKLKRLQVLKQYFNIEFSFINFSVIVINKSLHTHISEPSTFFTKTMTSWIKIFLKTADISSRQLLREAWSFLIQLLTTISSRLTIFKELTSWFFHKKIMWKLSLSLLVFNSILFETNGFLTYPFNAKSFLSNFVKFFEAHFLKIHYFFMFSDR